jgi:hypothetical protein
MVKLWPRIVWVLLWTSILPTPVGAQTAQRAALTPPQTANFPEISAYLTVYDNQGEFVHGIEAQDLRIFEDDRQISVDAISELNPGVQFVLAVNLGRSFAIRDANAISRYDLVLEALRRWSNTDRLENQDDLSLLISDGFEALHLNSAQELIEALLENQTDPRTATPSLDVLSRAIDVASEPTIRAGMGRAVLLLTPPSDRQGIAALQSLTSRAQSMGVHVFVWMISSPEDFTSQGADLLTELANQTKAEFFGFSAQEDLPNPDNYLEPLRYAYSLSYESRITSGDEHQLSARITKGDLNVSTAAQTFELSVQPPNPMFVSPPLQIVRQDPLKRVTELDDFSAYQPKQQQLEVLIEFPDGLPRSLLRTTLYVDGEIADENTSQPYNFFSWDISDYTTNGTHLLRIEVVDEMGLSGLSIETATQVIVLPPPRDLLATVSRNAPLIAGIFVLLSGLIVLLVLIVGGRIRPAVTGKLRRPARSSRRQRSPDAKDPVTQPVPKETTRTRLQLSNWVNRLSWPQRRKPSQAPAFLEPLEDSKQTDPLDLIPITTVEITFGKDPSLATLKLSDPSVDDLHARLRRDSQGGYILVDEDSTAGTWVNYTPISGQGVRLKHGDTIHIGRVAFRFKLSAPEERPKPVIIPSEPET